MQLMPKGLYTKTLFEAVERLSDWDDVEVYGYCNVNTFVVYAGSGCDQYFEVYVGDQLIGTTTDEFPAYFLTPEMAVAEVLTEKLQSLQAIA